MSMFKGFFSKFLSYMGFDTPETKNKKTKKQKKKTKTSEQKKMEKIIRTANKAVKAIEIAKELQTNKGKARYMSRLQNALKRAIADEAIEEIAKAEKRVKNYLAKQEASK